MNEKSFKIKVTKVILIISLYIPTTRKMTEKKEKVRESEREDLVDFLNHENPQK